MTDQEIAAAQAYVRLLQTTRAVLADGRQPLLPLLTVPITEADKALDALGMAGNEEAFFELVTRLQPVLPVLGEEQRVP